MTFPRAPQSLRAAKTADARSAESVQREWKYTALCAGMSPAHELVIMHDESRLVRETAVPDPTWRRAAAIFVGLFAMQAAVVTVTAAVLRLFAA